MTLISQMQGFITAVGTDWKNIWAKIGSGSLTTTATNLVAAINEVKATADAAISGTAPDATTSVKGIAELATDAESIAGTDPDRTVTPHGLAATFTDRIDTSTALGTSNVKVPSQNAVKAYADALIGAANAMVFKGVIDASTNPNFPAANAGDLYKISVAGKIGGASGANVEVGDTILCLDDSTSAGTLAAQGSHWNISQVNIDGAVVGPASSTSGNVATYSGTSGKLIQDGGVAVSTDGTLAANSDAKLPTEKAVKTYAQPVDTDLTAIAALTSAANKGLQSTGAGTWALFDLTAAGKALIDDADVAAQRTTLSVYSQAEIGDITTDLAAYYTAAKA